MKKILLTLLATTVLISCKKESFTIEGNIPGYKGTDYAMIEIQKGMKPKTLDSIKIKDGKFSFKGKVDSVDIAFIKIPSLQCQMPFFLENGDIEFKIDKDSIFKSKIGGTSNNNDLQGFNDDINALSKKLYAYSKANEKKYKEAEAKKDEATKTKLTTEAQKLQKDYMDFPKEYQKKNSNYLSLLILENLGSRMQMTPEELKTAFGKFNKELQNSKSGVRVNKIINPVAALPNNTPAPAPAPEKKK